MKTLTSSRLETALDGLGLAPEDVDVMVLDVQGAELLCLKGAGRYLDHVTFWRSRCRRKRSTKAAPCGRRSTAS